MIMADRGRHLLDGSVACPCGRRMLAFQELAPLERFRVVINASSADNDGFQLQRSVVIGAKCCATSLDMCDRNDRFVGPIPRVIALLTTRNGVKLGCFIRKVWNLRRRITLAPLAPIRSVDYTAACFARSLQGFILRPPQKGAPME